MLPAILDSLSALVASVPTFIGGQLGDLLLAILRPSVLDTKAARRFEPAQALINTIAKAVPAKSALPAIFKLWEEIDKSSAAVCARRCLVDSGFNKLMCFISFTFLALDRSFGSPSTSHPNCQPRNLDVSAQATFQLLLVRVRRPVVFQGHLVLGGYLPCRGTGHQCFP